MTYSLSQLFRSAAQRLSISSLRAIVSPPSASLQNSKAPFVLLHKSTLKGDLIAYASLFLILILLRYETILNINSRLIGGTEGDAGLYLWLIKSNIRDFFSLGWFNTKIFYPYSHSLAFSDNYLLPGFILLPFERFGLPLLTCYNVLLLSVQLLNGACFYKLCQALTNNRLVSIGSGSVLMSCSFLTGQLGHPQLQSVFFFPLALLVIFKFLSSPSLGLAIALGSLIFFSFLHSVYYSIFLILLYLFTFLAIVLLKPKQFYLDTWFKLFAGGVLGALPTIPFILPYLEARTTFGSRHLYESYYFSNNIFSYFSAPEFNLLYGFTSLIQGPEQHLSIGLIIPFLGICALSRLSQAKQIKIWYGFFVTCFILTALFSPALLPGLSIRTQEICCALLLWISWIALGVFLIRLGALERKLKLSIITNRDLIALFVFVAYSFFVIAHGPLGNDAYQHTVLGPFRVFYWLVPGLNSIRAISRVGILCSMGLIVLAALILSHWVKEKKIPAHVVPFVFLLILLENIHIRYPLEYQSDAGPVFKKLSEISSLQEVTIALPLAPEVSATQGVKSWSAFARYNVRYMLWLFDSNKPSINGFSGLRTRLMSDLPVQTANFPDSRSLDTLQSILGLRYIIYCSQHNPTFDQKTFEQEIQNYQARLRLREKDSLGNYLFELIPEMELTPDKYLLAPSYPGGQITLKLLARGKQDGAEVRLKIFAETEADPLPIANAVLAANKEARDVSFIVPELNHESHVPMLKLLFQHTSGTTVKLIGSSYAPSN